MFDIGFWEMCLIGVVGLLVVGPERLPSLARSLGRWAGKAQRMVANVKSDINRELESGELRDLIGEQRKQIEQLQNVVNNTAEEVESTTRQHVTLAEQSWAEQAARSVQLENDSPSSGDTSSSDAGSTGGDEGRKSA
ncbi:MAG: Sec-independent protein translocase protein TatB [Pseudomonadota bacterium]